MPRVLLIGTFSSLNKGDAAMQLSAARTFASAIPGAEITVLTPFPDIDRNTYTGYRVCLTNRRRPIAAFVLLARAWLWRVLRGLGIDSSALVGAAELEEYRRADVVVDLSGDTLTEDYGVACFISHLLPILTCIALKRPVVICAQTIGPLGITRPLGRFALNRVSLVTAREEITHAYLQDIGIDVPPRHLTADIAFLLEPAGPEKVSAILAAEGLDGTDRPLVGVVISRLMGHRFSPSDPESFEDMMAAIADHMVERQGAFVVLAAHVTGPGKRRDDRLMAKAVYRKMRRRDHAGVIEKDYRPEELKGLFGRFELLLGQRMHANIASLSMGVPTLALGYSLKTRGIMRMVGQEQWVCDITGLTLSEVTARIDAIWGERERVREELKARMAAIRESARQNVDLTQRLIASEGVPFRR